MKRSRCNFYKSNIVEALVLAFFLCVLCGNSYAQDFKTIHPGVEYASVDHRLGTDPVKINLLRLDLTKVRLNVHHALDAAIGTEKTSSIATRHEAVAAINAGFFRLDSTLFAGDASDVLQVDGLLYSEGTRSRVSLFLKNDVRRTRAAIGHINLWPNILIGKTEIRVSGINRERKPDEAIVYTPAFGRTTLTRPTGVEIVVCSGRVTKIILNAGSTPIPDCGFVFSLEGKAKGNIVQTARLRAAVRLHTNSAFLDVRLFAYLAE